MSLPEAGFRFYVWKREGKACSWWYADHPGFPCVDATDMDDSQFERLIREIESGVPEVRLQDRVPVR